MPWVKRPCATPLCLRWAAWGSEWCLHCQPRAASGSSGDGSSGDGSSGDGSSDDRSSGDGSSGDGPDRCVCTDFDHGPRSPVGTPWHECPLCHGSGDDHGLGLDNLEELEEEWASGLAQASPVERRTLVGLILDISTEIAKLPLPSPTRNASRQTQAPSSSGGSSSGGSSPAGANLCPLCHVLSRGPFGPCIGCTLDAQIVRANRVSALLQDLAGVRLDPPRLLDARAEPAVTALADNKPAHHVERLVEAPDPHVQPCGSTGGSGLMRWYDESCPQWCFVSAKIAAREALRQSHVSTYAMHEHERQICLQHAWRHEAIRLYQAARKAREPRKSEVSDA